MSMSEPVTPEPDATPESEGGTFGAGPPARLPVPEAAAGSSLALVLLGLGAVVIMLLRRRSTPSR